MLQVKVLVPTDFSKNSKNGLRFAIQWSVQQKMELLFTYVFHISRLPQWSDEDFSNCIKNEALYYEQQLDQFVKSVYKSANTRRGKYRCLALHGVSADLCIMDYCRKEGDIDYICIATRGAGKLNKIFGTHTGNLITKSDVPVIAVPVNYKRKPVRRLLYATDFTNTEEELKKILAIAKPLKAGIQLLHLAMPDEILPDKNAIEKKLARELKTKIDIKIARTDLTHSLLKDLEKQVKKLKPSLLIMFTDQQRNLFEKIFFPSKAEQFSFVTRVPLLAFKK